MSGALFDEFLPRPSTRSESFAPIPVCWPTLADTEIQEQVEELADWIHWLIERYALDHRTIPPCWARHGALVEELSALRTGWLTAYAQDARGDAPLHWHTDFAAARQRLTDWTARTGCRSAEHRLAPTRMDLSRSGIGPQHWHDEYPESGA